MDNENYTLDNVDKIHYCANCGKWTHTEKRMGKCSDPMNYEPLTRCDSWCENWTIRK